MRELPVSGEVDVGGLAIEGEVVGHVEGPIRHRHESVSALTLRTIIKDTRVLAELLQPPGHIS